MQRLSWAVFSLGFFSSLLCGQTLSTRPPAEQTPAAAPAAAETTVALTVPTGTPIKIALDREIKVKKVGQPVHGKVTEPVYAFDKVVIPAGTEATGTISEIDGVSKTTRTLAALNADLTPAHRIHVTFTQLAMVDGRKLPIHTVVTPAADGVLEFVTAKAKADAAVNHAHQNAANTKVREARKEAKRQWDAAMKQVHEPGKMHKLERMAEADLPVHGQYLPPGSGFDAELTDPLDFGTESVSVDELASIASVPPSAGVVHARLTTALSSAEAKKGDPVEAVLTEPLFDSGKLLLPVGSKVTGTVMEVRAARRLKHNGQLRILFHEVELPNGLQQKIESSLEGVEVAKGENLALDSEGGAQVTSPRSRYFVTAMQVALATQVAGDRDAGKAAPDQGSTGSAAANGASGFRLVGAVMSAAARSRLVSSAFGMYGAGMSVYSHFLARGNDVVYPKDMSMVIGLGTR